MTKEPKNDAWQRLAGCLNKPITSTEADKVILAICFVALIAASMLILFLPTFLPKNIPVSIGVMATGVGLLMPLAERGGQTEISKNGSFALGTIIGLIGLATTCITILVATT